MRFDVYGGYSGMILKAQKVSAEEARKRFEDYLKACSPLHNGGYGYEIRFECVKE